MFNKKKEEENIETNPFAKEQSSMNETENLSGNQQAEDVEEVENNSQDKVEDNTDKTNEELEQLKNQYVRLAADFDNFRKRQSQERENLLKYGAEGTLKLLLPVLDTYERGKKACAEMTDANQLRENYEVIFKQLFDALTKAGLKKIETCGKEFNPNLHEAVMQTPAGEHPENTIVDELQAGYLLDDRVLRAAMVNVAVGE